MDRQFSPNSIWQYIFGQNAQKTPPYNPPRPPFGGGTQTPPFGPPFGGGTQGPPFGGGTQGPPFGGGTQGPPFGGGTQGPPFGQPTGGGAPTSPPPTFVPQKSSAQGQAGVFAVDPGAIRPCTFRFVYLWLRGGNQFWAWLTFVGRESAAGYRWNGFRWVYFGVDLRQIESFVCR